MSATEDPNAGFRAFRALVSDDAALLDQLCGQTDLDHFVARAVELGRERGWVFGPAQVRNAAILAIRSWREGC